MSAAASDDTGVGRARLLALAIAETGSLSEALALAERAAAFVDGVDTALDLVRLPPPAAPAGEAEETVEATAQEPPAHGDDVLRTMWAAGHTGAEIAAALGHSAPRVYQRRKELGLPPRRKPALGAGPAGDEPVPGDGAGRWRREEDQILQRMWMAGRPARAIGEILGRPKKAVFARRKALGLPARRKGWHRAEEPFEPPTATRPCLRCGEGFASEGPHNRLCDACKHSSDWKSAGYFDEPAAPAPQRG